ncbi:class I SAM-dependent methyltransferase [Candidatus Bathyarchaeota archaeon]|nr:class I SAM-dependent methyltransferase [Candidatus Bathyarchaeota archaeon]
MDTEEGREITTTEWYDFIGNLGDIIPALHLGGKEATRALIQMCGIAPESHVLDVGCGTGYTACEIAREHGSRVTGIDISETMVSKAMQRARKEGLGDRVEFRVADVFSLPFDDAFYDIALFESVLTPIPGDKLEALMEVVRVVRPGGMIGANESFILDSAPEEFWRLAAEHPATHDMFSPERLRALFEEAGLEVVEVSSVKSSEAPSSMKDLGVVGLISFMVKSYWRVLGKLITDARFRRAAKVDDQVSKFISEHGGYVLIAGRVPR